MKIQRIEHVGVVVNDLAAAKAFFLDLGLEVQGEGEVEGAWVDRVIGLHDVKSAIVMLGTPDGQAQIELTQFYTPSDEKDIQPSFANTLGIRHITFAVEDIEALVAKLKKRGTEQADHRRADGAERNLKKSEGALGQVKTAQKVELAHQLGRPNGPYPKSQVARALGLGPRNTLPALQTGGQRQAGGRGDRAVVRTGRYAGPSQAGGLARDGEKPGETGDAQVRTGRAAQTQEVCLSGQSECRWRPTWCAAWRTRVHRRSSSRIFLKCAWPMAPACEAASPCGSGRGTSWRWRLITGCKPAWS